MKQLINYPEFMTQIKEIDSLNVEIDNQKKENNDRKRKKDVNSESVDDDDLQNKKRKLNTSRKNMNMESNEVNMNSCDIQNVKVDNTKDIFEEENLIEQIDHIFKDFNEFENNNTHGEKENIKKPNIKSGLNYEKNNYQIEKDNHNIKNADVKPEITYEKNNDKIEENNQIIKIIEKPFIKYNKPENLKIENLSNPIVTQKKKIEINSEIIVEWPLENDWFQGKVKKNR